MHIQYLPANQCYITMFADHPTPVSGRILFPNKAELRGTLKLCGLKLTGNKIEADGPNPFDE